MRSYDVIVIGAGSMGGAALRQLAGRGLSVLGLEQFWPAHDQGSAHGGSRIIRQSYFEGAAYVPLLRRAYQGWRRLEEESGRELMTLCGGLYLGDPHGAVFAGSLSSAQLHGLKHEVLTAAEVRSRFPTMRPPEHALGLYEADGGYVRPEETVLANIEVAQRAGAEIRFQEAVTSWSTTPAGGVEVATSQGRYGADKLVVTAGAWAPRLLAEYGVTLSVERQIFYWLAPRFTEAVPYARYTSPEHPVFLEETDGNAEIYGFPMIDGPEGGLKIAYYRQNHGADTSPDDVDRTVHPDEVDDIRSRVQQLFPHLTGPLVRAATCLYSAAPDEHFVVGTLPDAPQVTIGCGFSGHGFKFVPVMGEVLADLAVQGETRHDISLFDLARLRPAGARSHLTSSW